MKILQTSHQPIRIGSRLASCWDHIVRQLDNTGRFDGLVTLSSSLTLHDFLMHRSRVIGLLITEGWAFSDVLDWTIQITIEQHASANVAGTLAFDVRWEARPIHWSVNWSVPGSRMAPEDVEVCGGLAIRFEGHTTLTKIKIWASKLVLMFSMNFDEFGLSWFFKKFSTSGFAIDLLQGSFAKSRCGTINFAKSRMELQGGFPRLAGFEKISGRVCTDIA